MTVWALMDGSEVVCLFASREAAESWQAEDFSLAALEVREWGVIDVAGRAKSADPDSEHDLLRAGVSDA